MLSNLTYSTNIFNTLGILTSYSFTETVWKSYGEFAIAKMEEGILKLQGSIYSVDELDINKLVKEYESLNELNPVLAKIRGEIETIDRVEFRSFKDTSIKFFKTVDLLFETIHTEIHKHPYNDETLAALEENTEKLEKFTSVDDLVNDLRN